MVSCDGTYLDQDIKTIFELILQRHFSAFDVRSWPEEFHLPPQGQILMVGISRSLLVLRLVR